MAAQNPNCETADIGCPCCGYLVIQDTHDICPICGWEYDPVQSDNPDDAYGPNRVSLRQAQQNFMSLGRADDPPTIRIRSVRADDRRDPNWRALDRKGAGNGEA